MKRGLERQQKLRAAKKEVQKIPEQKKVASSIDDANKMTRAEQS